MRELNMAFKTMRFNFGYRLMLVSFIKHRQCMNVILNEGEETIAGILTT